jgi:hypothetical protein
MRPRTYSKLSGRYAPFSCDSESERAGVGSPVALAMVGVLIATLAWLSGRFNIEDLYGILD